MERIVW